jgi:hypothetical protein
MSLHRDEMPQHIISKIAWLEEVVGKQLTPESNADKLDAIIRVSLDSYLESVSESGKAFLVQRIGGEPDDWKWPLSIESSPADTPAQKSLLNDVSNVLFIEVMKQKLRIFYPTIPEGKPRTRPLVAVERVNPVPHQKKKVSKFREWLRNALNVLHR